MKTVSGAMLGYLQAETQTLNTCVLITRTDATVFGFTDADENLVIGGVTYAASTGAFGSSSPTTAALNVDTLEIVGALNATAITEADLMSGKWDGASIRVFMVNRNDLSAGTYEMRAGWLGQVTLQPPIGFTAEMRGLAQLLQQPVGRSVMPLCDRDLGDAGCTVNLAPFTFAGVAVTAVTSTQQFSASALTQAAGYFANGKLTWQTGANAGRAMDIVGFGAGGAIVLQLPMLSVVNVGDTFTIIAGCPKTFQAGCVTKFANGANFGGFPYVPGTDKAMRPGGV